MALCAAVLYLQVLTRRKRSQHRGRFRTLPAAWHRQRRRHFQRKHPRINFYRPRILMPGQRLNHLRGLPVIEHVHNVRMPECVWRHRDGEVYPIIIRPLYGGLQPVAHRLIGRGPEGFSPFWPFRGEPDADLMHIAGVGKRHQAYRIFGQSPASASHFLRQYANKRARSVQLERLRRQRTGLADACAGVPQRTEQKVMPSVRHIVKQRAHFRSE